MSILIDKNTRVMVQGITGKSGSLQAKAMLDAGTNIVAGVTPGKGGQEVYGIPVYNYVAEARRAHDFDTVICFVPPRVAKDSCFEAIDAGIRLLVLTRRRLLCTMWWRLSPMPRPTAPPWWAPAAPVSSPRACAR